MYASCCQQGGHAVKLVPTKPLLVRQVDLYNGCKTIVYECIPGETLGRGFSQLGNVSFRGLLLMSYAFYVAVPVACSMCVVILHGLCLCVCTTTTATATTTTTPV